MKKIILGIMALFLLALPFEASSKDFYDGKTLTIIVAVNAPAGGMALNAQLLAKFIGRHIPGNPSVIVTYKGGAGGVKLANYLNRENRVNDGTEVGMLLDMTLVSSVLNKKNIAFNLDSFAHIGGIDRASSIVVVRANTGVKTIDDAKTKEVIVGATWKRSITSLIPHMMNQMLGTNLKVVLGYKGVPPILAGMERGEVDGVATLKTTFLVKKPQWYSSGYVNVLALLALEPDVSMPGVPLLTDLVTNAGDKKAVEFLAATSLFARAFLVSKHVPQDRIDILRKAFDDTVHDPEFLAFAASRNLKVDPVSSHELESGITRFTYILASNPEVVTKLRALMGIE